MCKCLCCTKRTWGPGLLQLQFTCFSPVRPVAKIAAPAGTALVHIQLIRELMYADLLAVRSAQPRAGTGQKHINPTTCSYLRPRRLPISSSALMFFNCCVSRADRKPVISICMREVVCSIRQANFLVQSSLPPLWGPFSRASLAPAPPCQALLTFLASYRLKRLRLVTQDSAAAHCPIGDAVALHVVD
jgi:hypothetical protein